VALVGHLASALDAAHARGPIHPSVKPSKAHRDRRRRRARVPGRLRDHAGHVDAGAPDRHRPAGGDAGLSGAGAHPAGSRSTAEDRIAELSNGMLRRSARADQPRGRRARPHADRGPGLPPRGRGLLRRRSRGARPASRGRIKSQHAGRVLTPRDRLAAVGGELDIHTSPGHGTLISASIPLGPHLS
jgi:hypothetical protein